MLWALEPPAWVSGSRPVPWPGVWPGLCDAVSLDALRRTRGGADFTAAKPARLLVVPHPPQVHCPFRGVCSK